MAHPELDRLIVSNFGDLEAAANHIAEELQPSVAEAMDDLLETFFLKGGWAGLANWSDQKSANLWLASDDWLNQQVLTGPKQGVPIGPKQGVPTGNSYQCQFWLGASTGKGAFFWLTQLLGMEIARLVCYGYGTVLARGRGASRLGSSQKLLPSFGLSALSPRRPKAHSFCRYAWTRPRSLRRSLMSLPSLRWSHFLMPSRLAPTPSLTSMLCLTPRRIRLPLQAQLRCQVCCHRWKQPDLGSCVRDLSDLLPPRWGADQFLTTGSGRTLTEQSVTVTIAPRLRAS